MHAFLSAFSQASPDLPLYIKAASHCGVFFRPPSYHQERPIQKSLVRLNRISPSVIVNSLF
jgi:hypothetical protein